MITRLIETPMKINGYQIYENSSCENHLKNNNNRKYETFYGSIKWQEEPKSMVLRKIQEPPQPPTLVITSF
jgi:hypothetical protein